MTGKVKDQRDDLTLHFYGTMSHNLGARANFPLPKLSTLACNCQHIGETILAAILDNILLKRLALPYWANGSGRLKARYTRN